MPKDKIPGRDKDGNIIYTMDHYTDEELLSMSPEQLDRVLMETERQSEATKKKPNILEKQIYEGYNPHEEGRVKYIEFDPDGVELEDRPKAGDAEMTLGARQDLRDVIAKGNMYIPEENFSIMDGDVNLYDDPDIFNREVKRVQEDDSIATATPEQRLAIIEDTVSRKIDNLTDEQLKALFYIPKKTRNSINHMIDGEVYDYTNAIMSTSDEDNNIEVESRKPLDDALTAELSHLQSVRFEKVKAGAQFLKKFFNNNFEKMTPLELEGLRLIYSETEETDDDVPDPIEWGFLAHDRDEFRRKSLAELQMYLYRINFRLDPLAAVALNTINNIITTRSIKDREITIVEYYKLLVDLYVKGYPIHDRINFPETSALLLSALEYFQANPIYINNLDKSNPRRINMLERIKAKEGDKINAIGETEEEEIERQIKVDEQMEEEMIKNVNAASASAGVAQTLAITQPQQPIDPSKRLPTMVELSHIDPEILKFQTAIRLNEHPETMRNNMQTLSLAPVEFDATALPGVNAQPTNVFPRQMTYEELQGSEVNGSQLLFGLPTITADCVLARADNYFVLKYPDGKCYKVINKAKEVLKIRLEEVIAQHNLKHKESSSFPRPTLYRKLEIHDWNGVPRHRIEKVTDHVGQMIFENQTINNNLGGINMNYTGTDFITNAQPSPTNTPVIGGVSNTAMGTANVLAGAATPMAQPQQPMMPQQPAATVPTPGMTAQQTAQQQQNYQASYTQGYQAAMMEMQGQMQQLHAQIANLTAQLSTKDTMLTNANMELSAARQKIHQLAGIVGGTPNTYGNGFAPMQQPMNYNMPSMYQQPPMNMGYNSFNPQPYSTTPNYGQSYSPMVQQQPMNNMYQQPQYFAPAPAVNTMATPMVGMAPNPNMQPNNFGMQNMYGMQQQPQFGTINNAMQPQFGNPQIHRSPFGGVQQPQQPMVNNPYNNNRFGNNFGTMQQPQMNAGYGMNNMYQQQPIFNPGMSTSKYRLQERGAKYGLRVETHDTNPNVPVGHASINGNVMTEFVADRYIATKEMARPVSTPNNMNNYNLFPNGTQPQQPMVNMGYGMPTTYNQFM